MGGLEIWFTSDSIWRITYPELALRMTVAILLGGLIGIEREWYNHPAGFRTHILVCLGSATLMILSIFGFSAFVSEPNVRLDPARLAAQVVSGIGFLGAGAILRKGSMVTGLTTAASVWAVASIGLCVGAGFYEGAITAAVLVLVSLHLFNRLEKRWMKHRKAHGIAMLLSGTTDGLAELMRLFADNGVQVRSVKALPEPVRPQASEIPAWMHVHFQVKAAEPGKLFEVLTKAASLPSVQAIESSAYEYRKSDREAGFGATADPGA